MIKKFLDLGMQPLANNYLRKKDLIKKRGELFYHLEIGFNSKFLIEMLNNIDTEEVSVEMSDPSRAGIILPEKNNESDEDILMLVMPVMVN